MVNNDQGKERKRRVRSPYLFPVYGLGPALQIADQVRVAVHDPIEKRHPHRAARTIRGRADRGQFGTEIIAPVRPGRAGPQVDAACWRVQ